MYDIIVVGGGPAGLTAAVYALRAGKQVLVIEKNGFGGQIAYSPKVENIPGTQQISGSEFADQLVEQVLAYIAAHFREKLTLQQLADFMSTWIPAAMVNGVLQDLKKL